MRYANSSLAPKKPVHNPAPARLLRLRVVLCLRGCEADARSDFGAYFEVQTVLEVNVYLISDTHFMPSSPMT
jgi:hypothetical protein